MTAPDPRLNEIQARLDAATPGLWAIDKYDTGPFESIVSIANDYPCGWVEVARSIGDDAKFITNAPTDVAYLLAELRKAHEALERVTDALDNWQAEVPFQDAEESQRWYSLGKRHAAERIRYEIQGAAVAAAKGDEQ